MMQSKIGRLRVKAVLSQRHFGQALESDGQRMDFFTPIGGLSFEIRAAAAAPRVAYERGFRSRRALAARKTACIVFAEMIEAHALDGDHDNGTEIVMAYNAEPLRAATTACYGGPDITVCGGFGKSGFGPHESLRAFDGYTDCKTAWIAF
jgi:hypothetical protein